MLIFGGARLVLAGVIWLSVAILATTIVTQLTDPKNPFNRALVPAILIGPAAALVAGILHVRGRRIIREHRWLLCPRCHYDLRGCTSDVCPECGRPWTAENVEQLWRKAYQEDRAKRSEY